ncbi:MAG: ImmA/IrrE family metallo-endopeptidase [Thermoanaerobaculales bacterium]
MEATRPRSASDVLDELGITQADEIDVEAIASHCGATVLYARLSGCEARIIGLKDRAIITVRADARPERQRFSVGHELGHWLRDRHRVGFSCTDSSFQVEWLSENPERRANRFAAELLLPDWLFQPAAKGQPLTFATARALASTFVTSLTATAIRLVELGSFPAMVVCSDAVGKRKWFVQGRDVHVWPVQDVGRQTVAYEISHGSTGKDGPVEVSCDGWIDHPEAERHVLVEDSVPMGAGLVLSLLWWRDERQLLAIQADDES